MKCPMGKKIFGIGLFLLSFVHVARASGQFLPQEIAQREQSEEYLLSAEIVKAEPLKQGVTKPWKLYLKKGDIDRIAAWKTSTRSSAQAPGTAGNTRSPLTGLTSS